MLVCGWASDDRMDGCLCVDGPWMIGWMVDAW